MLPLSIIYLLILSVIFALALCRAAKRGDQFQDGKNTNNH